MPTLCFTPPLQFICQSFAGLACGVENYPGGSSIAYLTMNPTARILAALGDGAVDLEDGPMSKSKVVAERSPDERPLNQIQAIRLSSLSGVPAKELVGQSLSELSEKIRWRINPIWFLYELVCGQVVKVDPNSGLKYPVPGATVNVLDVDCDWLWFFPPGHPWGWVFPFGLCKTETLATTTTDACGKFCVWVPRFDIDWILTWRRERICFPDLFRRPSIADLLEHLQQEVLERPIHINPNPPDPAPLVSLLGDRQDLATAFGSGTYDRLLSYAADRTLGASNHALQGLLRGSAFPDSVQPPLHHSLRPLHERGDHQGLAEHMKVDVTRLEKLDLNRWYGPFLRCNDVYFPEWLPIFEVPDITIQVTQDTDGDGDPEIIFDKAFGTPWAIPTPQLELDAAPFALALPSPGCGPEFPCSDTPAIQTVGLMPIDPGFVESTHGFSTRPNPPRASGTAGGMPTYPSTAPFEGTLQLYGCVHLAQAQYYRILAEYAPGDGLGATPAFGAQQPLAEHWHVYHFGPFVDQVQAPINTDGWYAALDDGWSPLHLLMNWNPVAMGSYRLTLQVGKMQSGSIQVLSSAAPVLLFVDNTAPLVVWNSLRWRYQGAMGWTTLPWVCPLIQRDPNRDVEVELSISASASHLRAVNISAGGCGGATPTPSSVEHWHTNKLDNTWTNTTVYTVPAHAQPGCYGWTVLASSRAFNPAGYDNGLAVDWYYDPMAIYSAPSISVAIVNA